MKIFKHGHHRLFEADEETAKIVSDMLLDLERNGMDAVSYTHLDVYKRQAV